ncbi:MAG: hypothetical protein ACLRIS_22515 [Flavonifractor plautii]
MAARRAPCRIAGARPSEPEATAAGSCGRTETLPDETGAHGRAYASRPAPDGSGGATRAEAAASPACCA